MQTFQQRSLAQEPICMRGALVAASTLAKHLAMDEEHESILSHMENTQTMGGAVIGRTISQTLSISGVSTHENIAPSTPELREASTSSAPEEAQCGNADDEDEELELIRMTEAVLQASRDLAHLYETVGQHIQSFSPRLPLDFLHAPGSLSMNILHISSEMWKYGPNTGTLQLKHNSSANRSYLTHENHLHDAHAVLISLGDIDVPAFNVIHSKVAAQIDNEMIRLISIKNDEWHRQQELLKDGVADPMTEIQENTINTGMVGRCIFSSR